MVLYIFQTAGPEHILVHPQSETVIMGENATFHCEGNQALSKYVDWVIDGVQLHITNRSQWLAYHEQGIVVDFKSMVSLKLTIMAASEKNNNTEVWCIVVVSKDQHFSSQHAHLTVIGKNWWVMYLLCIN